MDGLLDPLQLGIIVAIAALVLVAGRLFPATRSGECQKRGETNTGA